MPAKFHLGTSGWSYDDWLGPFYPKGTPKRDYLGEYAMHFSTVEIDSTFYSIPRVDYVKRWREVTPDDFIFCAKFPKSITHEKVLHNCEREVTSFLKTMDVFGDKLGVLLLQFQYGFKPDQFDNLASFLKELPTGYRYAVEVRNRKWLESSFYEMLRENGICLALIDHPWMPRIQELTADFTYLRWLGDRKEVKESFDRIQIERGKDLSRWAEVIHKFLIDDVTTFGYVNNHYSGHSPETAKQMEALMKELEGE